jgi:hypothetical protein
MTVCTRTDAHAVGDCPDYAPKAPSLEYVISTVSGYDLAILAEYGETKAIREAATLELAWRRRAR